MIDQEQGSSQSQPCADASALAPSPSPRWMMLDRGGMIETFLAQADAQMAIHDDRTSRLAQSQRDAAFYRAAALYEVAISIAEGQFDPVRPADGPKGQDGRLPGSRDDLESKDRDHG